MTHFLPLSTRSTQRAYRTLLAASVLTVVLAGRSSAQNADSTARKDTSEGHVVQVSPHQILFTPQTKSATLELRNPDNRPMETEILVQFAYVDWPHGPTDTTVIATNLDAFEPHDTIIVNPGPKDHFAGRWLSGLPTHLTLAPHETKRVTLHLAPPAALPDGEYWARVVARIRPTDPRHGHSLDVQQKYVLPTKGHMAYLQDTCAVIYRVGTLNMGLAVGPHPTALIDSNNVGGVEKQNFSHALWVRLPLKLTGNAPFVGQMHSTYHNVTTGEDVRPNTEEYSLYKDAVVHWVIETDVLAPGKYTLTLEFNNKQVDPGAGKLLPMQPVKISLPFEVKPAWAY